MTDARIIIVHWVCGDGCCSDTDIDVVTNDWKEYNDFPSLAAAILFCIEKKLTYEVEDIYQEDI